MNTIKVLLFVCLLGAAPVKAQIILGIVRASDGTQLAGATVFVDSSTQGDVTDTEGRFILLAPGFGAHRVIARHIGFHPIQRVIHVRGRRVLRTEPWVLTPRVVEMGEILVQAPEPGTWRRLKTFTSNVIGRTTIARKALLVNPDAVTFTRGQSGFTAEASDPLVIENPATGFRIHVTLHSYEHDAATGGFRFVRRLLFEPMGEPTKRQVKTRDRLWKGSMRHFLWAWYHDRVSEEGFFVTGNLQRPTFRGGVAEADLRGTIVVTYGARPDGAYRTFATRHGVTPPFSKSLQVSRIAVTGNRLRVAENGFSLHAVRQEGWWAYRGVGDSVPAPLHTAASTQSPITLTALDR